VLPRLGADVAELDAYTYHFYGTFGWITDIARRMAFYRFSPGIRWVNRVHEKIDGLRGRAVAVPYIYHHYGNVVPPANLARKYLIYHGLGNPVPSPCDADSATRDLYLANATRVRPFRGTHPRVARALLAELERVHAAEFALIDRGFRRRRGPAVRARASLRALNEALRVQLRRLEHPFLYDWKTVAA
jgi:hypothetical protein